MSNYPVSSRKFTTEELEQITRATIDAVYRDMPKITRDTWTQADDWYPSAHRTALGLARLYGVTLAQAAGIIAALSPRVTWEVNLDEAAEIFTQGEDWGYAALRDNVEKALDIKDGSDPEVRLGGRKVRSFYRNILDPWNSEDVTLDGWMVKALGLPGGETAHRYLERKGAYDAFRSIARDHGIMPSTLQAAIWLHHRNGGLG